MNKEVNYTVCYFENNNRIYVKLGEGGYPYTSKDGTPFSYYNGYNETLGGDGMNLIDYEEIFPYLELNLSTVEIGKILNISKDTVAAYLNKYYTKEEIKERTKKLIGIKNSTAIEQYDLNGNFI